MVNYVDGEQEKLDRLSSRLNVPILNTYEPTYQILAH